MPHPPNLELPPEVAAARNREQAEKFIKAQFAHTVLADAELAAFANSDKDGAATAHSARKRAAEVVLKFLNEC